MSDNTSVLLPYDLIGKCESTNIVDDGKGGLKYEWRHDLIREAFNSGKDFTLKVGSASEMLKSKLEIQARRSN